MLDPGREGTLTPAERDALARIEQGLVHDERRVAATVLVVTCPLVVLATLVLVLSSNAVARAIAGGYVAVGVLCGIAAGIELARLVISRPSS